MELGVGIVSLALFMASCLAGVWAQRVLPAHHLHDETKDIVRLGIGAIGTLAALVLGMIIASTKGSFDNKSREIHQFAATLAEMDRSLAHYGPPGQPVRAILKRYAAGKLDTLWPDEGRDAARDGSRPQGTAGIDLLEQIKDALGKATPLDDPQNIVEARTRALYYSIVDANWLLATDAGTAIQPAFVVLLVFWLCIMFVSLGLFAPRNSTSLTFVFFCAAAFASAIFIGLDMDTPFSGPVQISSRPIQVTLAAMDR